MRLPLVEFAKSPGVELEPSFFTGDHLNVTGSDSGARSSFVASLAPA